MAAAILEIRDGVATGPLHHPVHKRPVTGQGGFLFSNFDTPPLRWEALCGVEGYVYQREPLAQLGHTVECWECRIILNTPEPEKEAPKPRAVARRRTCEKCGTPISHKAASLCRPCYQAGRAKPKCGTNSAYVTGCRCEACRQASRDYSREYRRTARALARGRAA